MNAIVPCPFPTVWTPQQIAGAVAPRLVALDPMPMSISADAAANRTRARVSHAGYLPRPALPVRFRMHG